MKSKTIFLCFCLLAGCLWSACSDNDKKEVIPDSLTLSSQELLFPDTITEQTLHLTSTVSWKITQLPEWLKAEPASGNAGEYDIRWTVTPNTTETDRTVSVEIEYGSKNLALPVSQTSACRLDFKEKQFNLSKEKQQLAISYTYSKDPEVTIPEDARTWLTLMKTKAVQEGEMIFYVRENDGPDIRTAAITVKEWGSAQTDTLRITQYPEISFRAPEETQWFIPADGGKFVVEIKCNVPLQAEFQEGTTDFPSWLKLESNEVKNGKSVLTFRCEANTASDIRNFSLNWVCAPQPDLKFPYTFTQTFAVQDGAWLPLHQRTKTPQGTTSTDIVFTGDGFSQEDVQNGTFDHYVRRAYEVFFSCEPYKSLKEYFSAYIVYAVSKDRGIPEEYKGERFDTHYGIKYVTENKSDFHVRSNEIYPIIEKNAHPDFKRQGSCIVMVANDTSRRKEADIRGVCDLPINELMAVALCPLKLYNPQGIKAVLDKFDHMVRHEAGGHGYGKLADEYDFGGKPHAEAAEYEELRIWQQQGYYMNISPTLEPYWAEFMTHKDKYPQIGVIPGGFYCKDGMYRSTQNSIMRGAEAAKHHSVYCRYLIWKRVMETFGEDSSVDRFIRQDTVSPEDEV